VIFWLATVRRYLLAAFAAVLLALVISFLATLLFANSGDELGIGFLLAIIFASVARLCLPLSLGITAELIQRKVLARLFMWTQALLRSLMALPIAVGLAYVTVFVGSRRPSHRVEIEIPFYALSAASAFMALRIRKQPPQLAH
jgi:hypothetical protein